MQRPSSTENSAPVSKNSTDSDSLGRRLETLTDQWLKSRPTAIAKPAHARELAHIRHASLELDFKSAKVDALCVQREHLYRDETPEQRRPNQDSVLVSYQGRGWHVSVGDGVGSLPRSEVASVQAQRFVHTYLMGLIELVAPKSADGEDARPNRRWDTADQKRLGLAMRSLLRAASHHVTYLDASLGGATTIAGAAYLNDSQILVYNVGDSAVSLLPARHTQPIVYSEAHSCFEELVRRSGLKRRNILHDVIVGEDGEPVQDLITATLGGGSGLPEETFVSVIDVVPG